MTPKVRASVRRWTLKGEKYLVEVNIFPGRGCMYFGGYIVRMIEQLLGLDCYL